MCKFYSYRWRSICKTNFLPLLMCKTSFLVYTLAVSRARCGGPGRQSTVWPYVHPVSFISDSCAQFSSPCSPSSRRQSKAWREMLRRRLSHRCVLWISFTGNPGNFLLHAGRKVCTRAREWDRLDWPIPTSRWPRPPREGLFIYIIIYYQSNSNLSTV